MIRVLPHAALLFLEALHRLYTVHNSSAIHSIDNNVIIQ